MKLSKFLLVIPFLTFYSLPLMSDEFCSGSTLAYSCSGHESMHIMECCSSESQNNEQIRDTEENSYKYVYKAVEIFTISIPDFATGLVALDPQLPLLALPPPLDKIKLLC